MLTGKQKRYLRSLAVNEKAIFQIGKDEISSNLIKSVNEAINVRELIKISLLKTSAYNVKDIGNILAEKVDCELVQIIGRTIVLYRKNNKEPKIVLP